MIYIIDDINDIGKFKKIRGNRIKVIRLAYMYIHRHIYRLTKGIGNLIIGKVNIRKTICL